MLCPSKGRTKEPHAQKLGFGVNAGLIAFQTTFTKSASYFGKADLLFRGDRARAYAFLVAAIQARRIAAKIASCRCSRKFPPVKGLLSDAMVSPFVPQAVYPKSNPFLIPLMTRLSLALYVTRCGVGYVDSFRQGNT